jgi:pimeloyl-ACP methyl ester carboxylesterase
METERSFGIFKTEVDASEYLEMYDAFFRQWPVKCQGMDIETKYGRTHINCFGSSNKDPLILLPGFNANSATWFQNIDCLSRRFNVFAVDPIGHPGRSIPRENLQETTSNLWLLEIMKSLSIDRVRLVGQSLGGWMALDFAVNNPERTVKVALLDPGPAFTKLNTSFLVRTLVSLANPTKEKMASYFKWMMQGNEIDQDFGRLTIKGVLTIKPQKIMRIHPFSYDQLHVCKVPVLVLLAEKSVIYNVKRVAATARRSMPSAQIEMISGASHVLHIDRYDEVNTRLEAFL